MAWSDVQAAFDFRGECSADAISVLRVLAYKVWKKGYAYCGTEYIAQAIRRRSRKTVHTAINELIARGYVYRFSGRYGGVRNVYFINIPGAFAVDNPVYKLALKQIEATGVCKLQPFGECNPRQIVCRPAAERCVKDAAEEVNNKEIKKPESEKLKSCEGADYTPEAPARACPQASAERTAPVDSPEFREQVRQFCKEAGASDFEAVRFYEHHQAEQWAVLEHMPLKTAAEQWVDGWKERDRKGWLHEQLEQVKLKYGRMSKTPNS